MIMAIDQRDAPDQLSPFLRYLAMRAGDDEKIPSLVDLSKELKVNTAALREQLEVARALGMVEVRPRTGIRRLPYSFSPAVLQSLFYALTLSPDCFESFSDLRNHVEASFWKQAVSRLTPEDQNELCLLLDRAEEKMRREPVQIPHAEHRALHLTIYRRLENPFVAGLLEAYWDMYEAVGLALYTDLAYLETVWKYHRRMVEAICAGNLDAGYQALIDHVDLIHQRSRRVSRQRFE
jgi:DNA-binding FadR family transcriptional regulator